jgi:hypothetical protein
MKKKKDNRGGKRKGAGRKKKEPTTLKTFRIPTIHLPELTELIKNLIKSFKIPKDES